MLDSLFHVESATLPTVEGHCAACRYGVMMRLGSVILKVESSRALVLMLGFADAFSVPFDAALVEGDDVVSYLSRDSSKPGRGGELWTVHATPEFAERTLTAAAAVPSSLAAADDDTLAACCSNDLGSPAEVVSPPLAAVRASFRGDLG